MSHHASTTFENGGARRSRISTPLASLTLVTLLCTLLTAPFENTALAWGRLGHRSAAKLTQSRLNPAAKLAIAQLLEPGESLADASLWADEQRRSLPETGPWHYVNVPLSEERYSSKFCPGQGCVVAKIDDFRKQVADAGLPREERQKALRFLVHFVQDMHQPLHVGNRDDRGGNDLQVQFFGDGSNLHRVWDSGLIERKFDNEDALVVAIDTLASAASSASWETGTVDDWATESLLLARRAYIQPYDKSELKRGSKLGPPYLEACLPLALERVSQSGVRLASILNAIFPETDLMKPV